MVTIGRKDILVFLFFGSLTGISELFISGLKIPYNSVVLSTIILLYFTIGRRMYPFWGSTLILTAIALLFKIVALGSVQCQPTALIMIGVLYEIFASIIISAKKFRIMNYIWAAVLASLLVFAAFAVFQTFIQNNNAWNTRRILNYVAVKGPLTAILSGIGAYAGLQVVEFLSAKISWVNLRDAVVMQVVMAMGTIAIWVAGLIA